MLRHRRRANIERIGEFADGPFTVNELTQDQEAMTMRHRFEKILGVLCGNLHPGKVNIHRAIVYKISYIYVKSAWMQFSRAFSVACVRRGGGVSFLVF